VCRQAGYFEHASYLAKKYERHEDYLRIQIEDAGNFSDALAYLRKLGPEAVCTLSPYFSYKLYAEKKFYRPRVTWHVTGEQCSRVCLKKLHNY